MRFLAAEVFFILFFIDYTRTELHPDGKNVCLTSENYEETVMVKVQKRKNEKMWCWKFKCPPRTRVVNTEEPRVITRTRIVPKCCDGFTEEVGKNYCEAVCIKGCIHGTCIAPNYCRCDYGFCGPRCDEECPEAPRGVNCVNAYNCSENGTCNMRNRCDCKPGWRGDRCELPCAEGYYGHSCEKKCNCKLGCNPETGACFTPAAVTREPKSMASDYFTEESTNIDHTIQEKAVSEMTELFESVATEASAENFSKSEKYSGEGEATAPYEGSSERATEEWGVSEVSNRVDGVSEATENVEVSSMRIAEFTEREATQRAYSEEPLNEKEIKFHLQNRINFLEDLETFSKSPDTEETESNLSRQTLDALDITNNEKVWREVTNNPQKAEKNETDNLINSGKGSSLKDDSQTKFHFLASLSIISGISLIIFVIGAKWLIVSHRKKVKKFLMATQREKIFLAKPVKPQEQKLFSGNHFMENPTYLSDIDINNTVPVLQTFKPVTTNN